MNFNTLKLKKTRKFNLSILLLFFGLLIVNNFAFGMKQLYKKEDKKENKKIEKKESKKVEFLSDPSDVFGYQLLPFIEKQEDVLKFRSVSKNSKDGVKKYRKENSKPVKLKEVNPENITKFLKLINQKPKGLDFFVAITIVGKKTYEWPTILGGPKMLVISSKNFKEILNLIGEKIKELTLINFDAKEIDLKLLKKCPIKKLTLDNCLNIDNKFIGELYEEKENVLCKSNLPQTLEELDLSHCDTDITGSTFDSLPKTLKVIKFLSLKNIPEAYIYDIPKTVETIYIVDTEEDTLKDPKNQEKILWLNKNKIKVLDMNGKKYPDIIEEIDAHLKKSMDEMNDFMEHLYEKK